LPDGLIIHGGQIKAGQVDGRHDHRIVMALSLAGMAVDGETVIDTAEAMNITFPNYVDLMCNIGAKIVRNRFQVVIIHYVTAFSGKMAGE
jgi:3-phosphoshikimate 1-carboxyvinyltransferase